MKWIPKVWGGEVVWADNELYCGKILEVKKDHFSSFHRHKKVEDWLIYKGQILLLSSFSAVLTKWPTNHILTISYNDGFVNLPGVGDEGEGELEVRVLKENDTIHLPSLKWHLFYGLENSEIFEVSTPDEESERLTESY